MEGKQWPEGTSLPLEDWSSKCGPQTSSSSITWNTLDMQILGPHHRPKESGLWGLGPLNLCFPDHSRCFWELWHLGSPVLKQKYKRNLQRKELTRREFNWGQHKIPQVSMSGRVWRVRDPRQREACTYLGSRGCLETWASAGDGDWCHSPRWTLTGRQEISLN